MSRYLYRYLPSHVSFGIEKCDLVRPFCQTCRAAKKQHECLYPGATTPDSSHSHFRWIEPARTHDFSPTYSDVETLNLPPESSVVCITTSKPPPISVQAFDMTYISSIFRLQNRGHDLFLTERPDPMSYALSGVSPADLDLNLYVVPHSHLLTSHLVLAASPSLPTDRCAASDSCLPSNKLSSRETSPIMPYIHSSSTSRRCLVQIYTRNNREITLTCMFWKNICI